MECAETATQTQSQNREPTGVPARAARAGTPVGSLFCICVALLDRAMRTAVISV